jgi:hypothetical protein
MIMPGLFAAVRDVEGVARGKRRRRDAERHDFFRRQADSRQWSRAIRD